MKLPQVRAIAVNSAQFVTGAIAAITFMSSKSVDLYAAWDKLYQGTQLILGAWAIIGPVLIGAYSIYKASTTQKLIDVAKDPEAPVIAQTLPVTPATAALGDALKTPPA